MKKVAVQFLIVLIAKISFAQYKKPNIIWITCEDMSYHIGDFGDKVVNTPNLNQLASEGTKYTQVYSTAGVCAPSRCAIATGMYQTSAGGHNMRTQLDKEQQRITGLPSYSAVLPTGVKPYPLVLRENGYYTTNNVKEDYQFARTAAMWDENSNKAHWRNRKDKNQPFFAIFNLVVTHESQVWMRDKEPLTVSPELVEIPPYLPDNPVVRKDFARFMSNVEVMDKQVGEIIAQLKEDGLYEDTYIFFFPDHGDGLPFVKREVYHRGLKVPMIIKFPKKDNAGETDNQLISFVDFAPTLFSLAQIPIPTFMQGQAFLGKYKARQPRKYIYGARDRMDTEYDRVRTVSDGRFQYMKNYNPEKPYYQNITYRLQQKGMAETLRLKEAGQLKGHELYWFRESKPEEELFDTQTDPDEFVNLADDPAYKAKLNELREELKDWEIRYKDLGAIPEKQLLNDWWQGKREPPVTAPPTLVLKNNQARLYSETEGALLAYKMEGSATWLPYTKSFRLNKGEKIQVIAERIGYKPSAIVELGNER
ncbi:sulfatase [Emticicia sp. BO119]|uniref:sulfatase family protein n=1 Tax=Emticicia sp. BO119 TaxID=2757768 RepID=UPI0015F0128A|nr:sulfatase [Emticicia sp. BO119]MBA4849423.1 sulfatase [Emticicia sp. BO119]